MNGGENPAYLIDFVKIIWDADVSILGEESHFGEPHFFNAVKLDGKWYYADPCYSDISVQCIGRNRVETDGNLSHLYFLCSDPTMREWYRGNFKTIETLYRNWRSTTSMRMPGSPTPPGPSAMMTTTGTM